MEARSGQVNFTERLVLVLSFSSLEESKARAGQETLVWKSGLGWVSDKKVSKQEWPRPRYPLSAFVGVKLRRRKRQTAAPTLAPSQATTRATTRLTSHPSITSITTIHHKVYNAFVRTFRENPAQLLEACRSIAAPGALPTVWCKGLPNMTRHYGAAA